MLVLRSEKLDQSITVSMKLRLINEFQKEFCDENTNIATLTAMKMVGLENIDYLVKMINKFQTNEPKLSCDKIYDFLEVYLSSEGDNHNIFEVYENLMKEYDLANVFKKDMGFQLISKVEEELEKSINEN